jgi:hypothetical protein
MRLLTNLRRSASSPSLDAAAWNEIVFKGTLVPGTRAQEIRSGIISSIAVVACPAYHAPHFESSSDRPEAAWPRG